MFERVVCFVDGSPDGLEALRQAAQLRDPGGELVGAVVCDRGLAAASGFEATHAARRLEEEAAQSRDAAAAEVEGIPSARVEIVFGRPAHALLGVAQRWDAQLLAVGKHGRSRWRGLFLGSFVTEIIHRAPCPVLVARFAVDGEAWAPRRITVGVDGSEPSLEAMAIARALGDRFSATVRVVSATGGKPVDRDYLVTLGDIEIDERPPVDALTAASEVSNLLVVGCRGLHGLRSLGSVSERVAHRAECSVLVVCRGVGVARLERAAT